MAMVLSAMEVERENIRNLGYDLNVISPHLWHAPLFAVWERAANMASAWTRQRAASVKQIAPELVLAAARANRRVASSAQSIVATTAEALLGLSGPDIELQYDEWELWRVPMIAQTESYGALAWGQYETARQTFQFKRWVTQEDADVRDSHQQNAFQGVIPYEQEFSNGQLYPLEGSDPAEIINCRCILEDVR